MTKQQSILSLKEQLSIFFTKNPDFVLKVTNIRTQFFPSSFTPVRDKETLKKELKMLNRLHKLAGNSKELNALLASIDIEADYGIDEFAKQFGGVIGSIYKAKQLYKKAVTVNNKTTALITAYKM